MPALPLETVPEEDELGLCGLCIADLQTPREPPAPEGSNAVHLRAWRNSANDSSTLTFELWVAIPRTALTPNSQRGRHATASHGHDITWEWSSRTGCPHALHVARIGVSHAFHSCGPARRLGGSAECAYRQAVKTPIWRVRPVMLRPVHFLQGSPRTPALEASQNDRRRGR